MITALGPATVLNDGLAQLTVSGAGFADGITVAVGGQPLVDVTVRSATRFTARLPAGLCPGSYSATVGDALGRQAEGGQLLVQGKRTATVASNVIAAPPITLNGRDQKVAVPLPAVLVEDTTCGHEHWQLAFSVSDFTLATPGRPSLAPRSIELRAADGVRPVTAPLTRGAGGAGAALVIPRPAGSGPARLNPSAEIIVPASAFAGQYIGTVSVELVEVR